MRGGGASHASTGDEGGAPAGAGRDDDAPADAGEEAAVTEGSSAVKACAGLASRFSGVWVDECVPRPGSGLAMAVASDADSLACCNSVTHGTCAGKHVAAMIGYPAVLSPEQSASRRQRSTIACRSINPPKIYGCSDIMLANANTSKNAASGAAGQAGEGQGFNLFALVAKSANFQHCLSAQLICAAALDLMELVAAMDDGQGAETVALRVPPSHHGWQSATTCASLWHA